MSKPDKNKVAPLSDAELAAKLKSMLESGRHREIEKTPVKRRSTNRDFFNVYRSSMKMMVDDGISYAGMVKFLRELDPGRFAKLSITVVRDWVVSQPDLKQIVDAQISAGTRATRPPSSGRPRKAKVTAETKTEAVVQPDVSASEPVNQSVAPVAPHAPPVVVEPRVLKGVWNFNGLKVKVFEDPPDAMMAAEDYPSPLPNRPPLIAAGQMLYQQATAKFSDTEVYKLFGLSDWGAVGGLMDRAISYWRDNVLDPKRRADFINFDRDQEPGTEQVVLTRAYISDKDRLVRAAEKFAKEFGDGV